MEMTLLFQNDNGNVPTISETVLETTCENFISVINGVFEMTKLFNLKFLAI
jgi:hypothetical protein